MNFKVYLFFKTQFSFFLALFALYVLPLFLFFKYSTYPLPKVQYVFLGVLFSFHFAVFNEKKFRRKMEGKVSSLLKKKLSRVPSIKEIDAAMASVLFFRGGSVITAALLILLIMIMFNQF